VRILSDAGTALRSYAEGGLDGEGIIGTITFVSLTCWNLWGFDTLVALLARRLLSTRTENACVEDYPQTASDFVMGCEQDLICPAGREKFSRLFGVDLAQSNGNEYARTAANVFREQALWGERGMTFGVAACSNHLEGMHGRLTARVQNRRNLRARFAETTSAITASAATWSEKVKRGCRATTKKVQQSACEHHLNYQDCPGQGHCDKGALLPRRLGRQVPCADTIYQCGWLKESRLLSFLSPKQTHQTHSQCSTATGQEGPGENDPSSDEWMMRARVLSWKQLICQMSERLFASATKSSR
jgi:predicted transcriptional regulator